MTQAKATTPDHDPGTTPEAPGPDAGTVGGAKSPGPAKPPAPDAGHGAGGAFDFKPKQKRKGYDGPPLACRHCGRPCKNPGGLARHEKACKQAPAVKVAPAPEPAPARKLDDWQAEQTAAEGAAKAAAVVEEVAAAEGGVAEVIARMDAAEIGVPDLIALVCLRTLPPPLSEAEYAQLRMAWRDTNVSMPPWLLTALVTLAVIGPRAMMHPTLGPWLRSQLVGKSADPEPPPRPTPIVTPVPDPEPMAPDPKPPAADATEARRRLREAMDAA